MKIYDTKDQYRKLLAGCRFTDRYEKLNGSGKVVRMVQRDGKDIVVTDDFNPNRINVVVERGVITDVISVG